MVIIFIISLGLSAKYIDSGSFAGSGPVEAGNILSFGAAIVGFGLGWASLAADYTVNLPEDVSGQAVFWLTYVGLNLVCSIACFPTPLSDFWLISPVFSLNV